MLLFINSTEQQCGVHQYGKRMFDQLAECNQFEYVECASAQQLADALQGKDYRACILNYHPSLFPWWNPLALKTFYIFHESDFPFDRSAVLNTDPTSPIGIPRPISQHRAFADAPSIPTFGSFGFGFYNKGFDRILDLVQDQYDNAHIRLVLTFAHYGDADGRQARDVVQQCMRKIKKPGIKLFVSHDFLSDKELVTFLASNSMNIFLYDTMPGRGCSSVIDFALAAGKPIAISDSVMFRHIYSDAICAYKRPLRDILADGDKHVSSFLDKWNPSTLRTAVLDRVRDLL